MTTASESHDAQLAAIKARHAEVRAQFADPGVTEIAEGLTDLGVIHQAGMLSVYLDPIGRFWTVSVEGEPRKIVARMVFDPHGTARGREDFDIQNYIGLKSPHAQDAA